MQPAHELRLEARRFMDVQVGVPLQDADAQIGRIQPQILVFEFDFPDQTRLRAMQHMKQRHPGLPILMLTVQHSEGLAVWSFRARVWNYLVKPVQLREFRENLAALTRIVADRGRRSRTVQLPVQSPPREVPARSTNATTSGLQAAVYYVEQRFREKIRAEEVARQCGLTRFAFSREFRRVFGMTFVDFVLRHRVREACRLLQAPDTAVTDVGYAVGFNDPSHFGRIFKRYVGLLPSEYAAARDKPVFDVHSTPVSALEALVMAGGSEVVAGERPAHAAPEQRHPAAVA